MHFKNQFLILSLIVVLAQVGFSQSLDFNFRYGIPTNPFRPYYTGDQKEQLMNARTVADFTLITDYKIPCLFKTNYFFGLEFGHTIGYQPLIGWGSDRRLLENLVYTKQRISLRWLGLEKRFNLLDEKLWLSANLVFLSRFYLGNDKGYSTDFKTNNDEWIEYRYDFRMYHNKVHNAETQLNFFDLYLSTEYGLKLGGVINDKIDWNFNMTYYRNLYNYYNFELDIMYHKTLIVDGVETPFTETYDNAWNQSFQDDKLLQREHYFALGFGVSYKF